MRCGIFRPGADAGKKGEKVTRSDAAEEEG